LRELRLLPGRENKKSNVPQDLQYDSAKIDAILLRSNCKRIG
jgi:hypothetical protein